MRWRSPPETCLLVGVGFAKNTVCEGTTTVKKDCQTKAASAATTEFVMPDLTARDTGSAEFQTTVGRLYGPTGRTLSRIMSNQRRPKRFLTAEQKYDLW